MDEIREAIKKKQQHMVARENEDGSQRKLKTEKKIMKPCSRTSKGQ